MANMRRDLVAAIVLTIIVSLHVLSILEVAAPPLSYGYTCGLVSAVNADVQISHGVVNVTITPELVDGENLTHSIKISSRYNITNTADHGINFLTSYVRSSWAPHITYLSVPMNVTIEGNSSHYNATVEYNISTRAALPVAISSRYPSGFFTSFFDPQIDVVNLTMTSHANLVLSLETEFLVGCFGNYYDFRYGLDMQKMKTDSAHLDGRLYVTNTSLLIRTDFLNSRSRNVVHVGTSSVATWSISDWEWGGETLYPGMQFEEDVFTDYIGVQLWQSEYHPPGYELDFRSQILIILIGIPTLIIILVTLSRRSKLS